MHPTRNETIQIIRGDITTLDVAVIVNAANETLLGGGGVDGAIHAAAGPELRKACFDIGGCEVGQAVITNGYDLPCQYVVHTVGPRWIDGKSNEASLLASCYMESLKLAHEYFQRSIAFPAISTGVFGYPVDKAAKISIDAIRIFQMARPDAFDEIILCAYSNDIYDAWQDSLFGNR